MATTTNYGFEIPDDTDLVKDGALAMRDLGQDVDTAMFTALNGKEAGMLLLSTTTFSAVNSVSIPNGTFTSSFKNYHIIINVDSCTSGGVSTLRFRASGVDASGNNYDYALQEFTSGGGPSAVNGVAQTSIRTGFFGNGETFSSIIDLFNPMETLRTSCNISSNRYFSTGVNGEFGFAGIDLTTAYDAFTFFNNDMTGSIRVYGYNQ
jgi:hypothetical protein